MKKLKNKTFILISSILSAFLLFILVVFNISIYNNEIFMETELVLLTEFLEPKK